MSEQIGSKDDQLEKEKPVVNKVLEPSGEVSDEVDYAVNRYLMSERGYGLTACQPSLVEIEDGSKAIRFKLDSTFVDSDTDEVKGYGNLNTKEGFVGEMFISYNPENEDMHMMYITPMEEIEKKREEILDNPEKYPPKVRPKGKY